MRALIVLTLLSLQTVAPAWLPAYQPIAQKLIAESRSSDFAWRRLAELTDTFGHRLSGSDSLEKAIDWAVAAMKADGLENVHKEPVMVPKWVRGRESLELVSPIRESLPMIGLGGTVATPPGGLEADVLVVRSFDELDRRAGDARGKIVLYNVAFTEYGPTVEYRRDGPSRAAKAGAVAAFVRSVGPVGLRTVHTGGTHFDADVQSYNVVGELRGRERPDEIVVVGGHCADGDRHAESVETARRRPPAGSRRRRRHRARRRRRQYPDDGAERSRRPKPALLHGPPHGCGHDRADLAEADVGQRSGGRDCGLRNRGASRSTGF